MCAPGVANCVGVRVTWVPACAGTTEEGRGNDGGGMRTAGSFVRCGVRVTWVPACAGMTEERGAGMTEERGAGMTVVG